MEKQLTPEQQKELIRLSRKVCNGIEQFKALCNTSPDYKQLREYLNEIDPPKNGPSPNSFAAYMERHK